MIGPLLKYERIKGTVKPKSPTVVHTASLIEHLIINQKMTSPGFEKKSSMSSLLSMPDAEFNALMEGRSINTAQASELPSKEKFWDYLFCSF